MGYDFSKCKIPTEWYLTTLNDGGERLGFMSPHGDDAAAEKRRSTQLNWAYGHRWRGRPNAVRLVDVNGKPGVEIDIISSIWTGSKYEYSTKTETHVFPEGYEPEVLDNAPRSGFEITESVRRYGWNGGNVVWRVQDPRGFCLEIPSENLAMILDVTDILKGKIQGEMCWVRKGNQNILVPTCIPELDEIRSRLPAGVAKPKNRSEALKDMRVGDKVVVDNQQMAPSSAEHPLTYIGRFRHYKLKVALRIGGPAEFTVVPVSKTGFYHFDLPVGASYGYGSSDHASNPTVVSIVERGEEGAIQADMDVHADGNILLNSSKAASLESQLSFKLRQRPKGVGSPRFDYNPEKFSVLPDGRMVWLDTSRAYRGCGYISYRAALGHQLSHGSGSKTVFPRECIVVVDEDLRILGALDEATYDTLVMKNPQTICPKADIMLVTPGGGERHVFNLVEFKGI